VARRVARVIDAAETRIVRPMPPKINGVALVIKPISTLREVAMKIRRRATTAPQVKRNRRLHALARLAWASATAVASRCSSLT
jgi:hypothetical protein